MKSSLGDQIRPRACPSRPCFKLPCPAPAPPCLTANPSSPEPPKSPNGACNSIEKVSLTEGGNQKYVRGALSVFLLQFNLLFHIPFFFHTTFRGCRKRFHLSLSLTFTSVDPCPSTPIYTTPSHLVAKAGGFLFQPSPFEKKKGHHRPRPQ